MNERIDKLMVKAGAYFGGEGVDYSNFDPNKFALLIVRECLNIVEPDEDSGDEWCVTLKETAQVIKEHFGVEE